jgi:hypothetical protein
MSQENLRSITDVSQENLRRISGVSQENLRSVQSELKNTKVLNIVVLKNSTNKEENKTKEFEEVIINT